MVVNYLSCTGLESVCLSPEVVEIIPRVEPPGATLQSPAPRSSTTDQLERNGSPRWRWWWTQAWYARDARSTRGPPSLSPAAWRDPTPRKNTTDKSFSTLLVAAPRPRAPPPRPAGGAPPSRAPAAVRRRHGRRAHGHGRAGHGVGHRGSIARVAVGSVLGPSGGYAEQPAAAPPAAAENPCANQMKAFSACIDQNQGEIAKCQVYVDMLSACREETWRERRRKAFLFRQTSRRVRKS